MGLGRSGRALRDVPHLKIEIWGTRLEALFGGGIEGERHGGSITLGGIWWEGRALRDVPRLKIEIWNNRPDGLFSM